MRQTEEFLRGQLTSQFPLRARKIVDFPLRFSGDRNEIRYAAALPTRVAEGGVYYFRLAVVREGDKSRLVQERVIPDPDATTDLEFRDGGRSVLAEGIDEMKIQYYGRDAGAADTEAPTWRDRWDDKQRLPQMVRIDVVPKKGAAWPSLVVEPRQAAEAGCRNWDATRSRCMGL
jgi:general secretion pathway protein J